MNIVAETRIEAKIENLANIRHFVKGAAMKIKCESDAMNNMILAMNEAVTNIIVHGYQGKPGYIEIEVGFQDDIFMIRIRDQARLYDPNHAPIPDTDLPLEQRKPGGMGVQMMYDFTDEIIYRVTPQGENELTLLKKEVF